ncbi:plasmid recombination enzyme (plasmid) [Calothrix sp. NIES-4071]|nr:plasmid recombination enzyme [Calothrix sp. NIES-4071]BAZ64773.1 plasmid recombination enzyme [Calothrix sp. NIES-4105]
MAYSVCRIEKIKTWANLASSAQHTARGRETLNAELSVNNAWLIGAPSDDINKLFIEKIGAQPIRSNAVLGVEILLTASPDYFRPDNPELAGMYIPKRVDDFASVCSEWLTSRYFDRVIRAILHLDESTPHIHAYIVPLDNQGKLSARALFNGRQKLSELQDSFARAVEHLGIERGVKGSKAKHTDIKKYYAAVNSKSFHINLEDVLPSEQEAQSISDYRALVKQILQPQLDTLNKQLVNQNFKLREKQKIEETAIASERERRQLEARVQNLSWTLELWESQANLLRDIPLESIAYQLGLHPHPKYQGRWINQNHTVIITGSRFYDFIGAQHGGGGAIDLVMHLLNCNFREAVAWLHDTFGESETLRAVTHHARVEAENIIATEKSPQFVAPVLDESKWGHVRSYLIGTRKLPAALIDNLHAAGLIYSDEKQNAVFLMRSLPDGEITGASIRGTYGFNNTFHGIAKGSKLSKGWFHVSVGGEPDSKIMRAVLAKSPIEALSIAVLNHSLLEKTIYIAVDSPQCMPVEFLSYFKEVIAAYDNDAVGEEIAGAIKKVLPQTTRLKPSCADWNQQLVLMR